MVRYRKKRYGINIHDTKISYIQVNSKERNSALIQSLTMTKVKRKYGFAGCCKLLDFFTKLNLQQLLHLTKWYFHSLLYFLDYKSMWTKGLPCIDPQDITGKTIHFKVKEILFRRMR